MTIVPALCHPDRPRARVYDGACEACLIERRRAKYGYRPPPVVPRPLPPNVVRRALPAVPEACPKCGTRVLRVDCGYVRCWRCGGDWYVV